MASLLAVRSTLDLLDGPGAPGRPNLIDIVTELGTWSPQAVRQRTIDHGRTELSWQGTFAEAKLLFTCRESIVQRDRDTLTLPRETFEWGSSLEIVCDEGGDTRSVLSFRRRSGSWDSFGIASARLTLESTSGMWRYPVLGYPHTLQLTGWAPTYSRWYLAGAESDPPKKILSGWPSGGAVRVALHLLECAVGRQWILEEFPSLTSAEIMLSKAVHGNWRAKRSTPHWKRKT